MPWSLSALVLGLGVLVVAGEGDLRKVVRDAVYLGLIWTSSAYLLQVLRHGRADANVLIKAIVLNAGIVLPLISLLIGDLDAAARLTGISASPTVSASLAFLLTALAYFGGLSWKWIWPTGLVSLSMMLLTGTRTGLVLLMSLWFYIVAAERGRERWKVVLAGTLLPVVSLGVLGAVTGNLGNVSEAGGLRRLVDLNDLAGGSAASRLTWYASVWEGLRDSDYIGGLGGGAAERALGVLPHFDLLRYWYDYSVAFVVLLFALLAGIERSASSLWSSQGVRAGVWRIIRGAYWLGAILALSLHNIFQTVDGAIGVVLLLVLGHRRPRQSVAQRVSVKPALSAAPPIR